LFLRARASVACYSAY